MISLIVIMTQEEKWMAKYNEVKCQKNEGIMPRPMKMVKNEMGG